MKILFVIIAGVLWNLSAQGQDFIPVSLKNAVSKTVAADSIIFIKAMKADRWQFYSQSLPADAPVKTGPSWSFRLNGNMLQPVPLTRFYKTYNKDNSYFGITVLFQQKIKLVSRNAVFKAGI